MCESIRRIFMQNKWEAAEVDRLLLAEGIHRDANLTYTCGIFDRDDRLVATGSAFANTIRCLAVDSGRRGEGLLNKIVSHLVAVLAQQGQTHLFLYTKCETAVFFREIGFYEIARIPEKLVFMENKRNGFSDYCRALLRGATLPEDSAAIVMHANPFTLGHRYLIEQAVQSRDPVHVFLLTEEQSPIPYAVRYALVEKGVAGIPNVTLHPSGPYMISSATFPSYFLRDSDAAVLAQAELDATVFAKIANVLNIRTRYLGEEPMSRVTSLYNEVLLRRLPEQGVACRIIPRLQVCGRTISASCVRQAIHDQRLAAVRDMLPQSTYDYFASAASDSVRSAIAGATDVMHH